jgi:uncharacterized RDD family membrane protein YckC
MCPVCEKHRDGRPICAECDNIGRRDDLVAAVRRLSPSRERIEQARGALQTVVGNKELRRVIALVIDTVVVCIAALPLSLLAWEISGFLLPEFGALNFWLCLYLSLGLVGSAYHIVSTWRWQATFGKWMMGLKVLSMDGDPLTFRGAMWRWVGFLSAVIWMSFGFWAMHSVSWLAGFVSSVLPLQFILMMRVGALAMGIFFSLGILISFAGKEKRGFHDILGYSRVVVESKKERRITIAGTTRSV